MIRVESSLCLGCQSCSNVCPSQKIVRTEEDGRISISWKSCNEQCDLCLKACPTKALSLAAHEEAAPECEASFDMAVCKICRSRYATEPMLKMIESSLPSEIQKDMTGLEWIRVCPECRRNVEAKRLVGQILPERRRKDFRCSFLFIAGKRGLYPGRVQLLYDL
ncbi:MAG: Ferredoxin [Methanosaeta sp. PtaU1.Bin112]|nr:MAG: Ferredoxin [Methanosaeta sp. PtaU1.Bin112]